MITLTREEAQQILDALQCATPPTFSAKIVEDWQSAVELLRARLAQPEPEPWAGVDFDIKTAPPQRKWQRLTGEEIMDACAAVWASHPIDVGNVVQDLLKEKNA